MIETHGHEIETLLRGPKGWLSCEERANSYKIAIFSAGLQTHVVEAPDTTLETGKTAFAQAIQERPETTAIVASNDALAIGAICAARQMGLKIPKSQNILCKQTSRGGSRARSLILG